MILTDWIILFGLIGTLVVAGTVVFWALRRLGCWFTTRYEVSYTTPESLANVGNRATIAFGKLVRLVFFFGVAGGLINYSESADFTGFNTPFAALTLKQLAMALGNLCFLIGAAILWLQWAFTSEEKLYEGWAGLGMMFVFGGFVFWLTTLK